MLIFAEFLIALAAVVGSLAFPSIGTAVFARIERAIRNVGRKQLQALFLVGVASLVARAAILPMLPSALPRIDDEYSHLLLADTLMHGRLANPTHPMYQHFETLEVNMVPAYASVYPPVQGIFLAAGRLLAGSAFFGVMLSVALMCGAICWMLQGWMSPGWALLGGVISIVRFGMFSYWADSYMGGASTALGGALLLGALARIKKEARPRYGVIAGIGIAILANSRPYEGFLLCAVVGAASCCWLWGLENARRTEVLRKVFVPIAIVLCLCGMATMYYNWRLTGSVLRNPYQLAWDTYGMIPKFPWQSLRPEQPAALRHEFLADFYYVLEKGAYVSMRTWPGLLQEWSIRAFMNWCFYLGPLLTLPFVASAVSAKYGAGWKQLTANSKLLVVCVVVVTWGVWIEVFTSPHYASPITGAVVALALLALRELRTRGASGVALSRAIVLLSLGMLVLRAAALPLHVPITRNFLLSIYYPVRHDVANQLVQGRLAQMPGPQLVLVHYPPGIIDSEDWLGWVHNEADIDHAKVVWAWDMGLEKNQELLNYFRDRKAWVVDAGERPPVLRPYINRASGREGP